MIAPLLACVGLLQGPAGSPDPEAVRRIAARFFSEEMAEHRVPGGAFAFVAGGEVVVLEGFGMADLEAGVPVDPRSSVFRVGSISKTVTAAAALQRVERGELDLHADVESILGPGLVPSDFEGPVTLHQLLTHTAGFGERMFGQHTRDPSECLALEDYLRRHMPRPIAPPGLLISYNDHGTALAGLLVEKAAGLPFARATAESIFAVLGMTRSTFEQVDLPRAVRDGLARAYRLDGTRHAPIPRDYVQTSPAAGLFTTVSDLGRFAAALLERGELDGRRILSASTARTLLAPAFRHDPSPRGRALGLAETDANGRRGLKKSGQASGFNAQMYLLPDERVGWVSVTNLSIFNEGGGFGPVAGFHDRLGAALLDGLFPAAAADDTSNDAPGPGLAPGRRTDRRRFVGTYRSTSDPRDTWDGALIVNQVRISSTDDGDLVLDGARYTEVGPLLFRRGSTDRYVRLFEDAGGRIRWAASGGRSYRREPPWADGRFGIVAGSVLLATALVGALVSWRLSKRAARLGRPSCPGSRPARLASLALLAFVVTFTAAVLSTDVQALFSGPTTGMLASLALPPIAAGACSLATLLLIGAVARGRGTRAAVACNGVTVAACALALLLLDQWNLFGWRL